MHGAATRMVNAQQEKLYNNYKNTKLVTKNKGSNVV